MFKCLCLGMILNVVCILCCILLNFWFSVMCKVWNVSLVGCIIWYFLFLVLATRAANFFVVFGSELFLCVSMMVFVI